LKFVPLVLGMLCKLPFKERSEGRKNQAGKMPCSTLHTCGPACLYSYANNTNTSPSKCATFEEVFLTHLLTSAPA
jgi:hypothetical protein